MKDRRNYTDRFVETEAVPEAPVVKKTRTGHISGCELLNVRKEPIPTAPVIAVLNTSDSFAVRDEDNNSLFYKVRTSEGVSGYCMKQFVDFYE